MKKRKVGWLLNIATICLSLCVIAIGVYSLKQASLNVGGSIGFVAHDLNVKYSGTVSNAINKDGTEYSNNITKETDLSTKWDLGTMYFNETTDYISLPYDEKFPKSIEVSIKIYNYSAFAVKANVVEDEDTTTMKTKLEDSGVTMNIINNPYIAPAKTPDSVATVGEIKIIFTLVYYYDYDESINPVITDGRDLLKDSTFDFGNVTINVEQTKNETTEIKYGEIGFLDSENNYGSFDAYYVEMGKYDTDMANLKITTGDKMKWVIYKVVENGKEVALNSLDDVGNYIENVNGRYLAKQNVKYYCLQSIYRNIQFCNNMYYDTDKQLSEESDYVTLSRNGYGQIWTDYATSNIRDYLDGITIKPVFSEDESKCKDKNNNIILYPAGRASRKNINFYDDFSLTNDILFSKAQNETITDFSGNYYTSIEQKFWACSLGEVKTIENLGLKGFGSSNTFITRTCNDKGYICAYNINGRGEDYLYILAQTNGCPPLINFAFVG